MFRLTLGGLGRRTYFFVRIRVFTVVIAAEKAGSDFMQIRFFVLVDK